MDCCNITCTLKIPFMNELKKVQWGYKKQSYPKIHLLSLCCDLCLQRSYPACATLSLRNPHFARATLSIPSLGHRFASRVLQPGTQVGIAQESPAGCCHRANWRNVTFLFCCYCSPTAEQNRKELVEWIPNCSKLFTCHGVSSWWVEGTKQTCREMAINDFKK